MRVGVIRGDLPGPLYLGDLEPVSRYNPSTEPRGQEIYVSRPTVAEVEAVLADPSVGAGAVLEGSDISGNFPITINGTNDDLRIRTSATAAYTVVSIAQAAYANLDALLAALNTALAGTGVTARAGTGSGSRVALESNTKGVASYLQNDTAANGSTANTPLGLANGAARTMPTAAAFITALLPVGGPLDVEDATINAVGATTNANALSLIPSARGTQAALADAVAPQFADTPVAIESFQVGMIAGYRSANYNPDPRQGLSNGAAIVVVQDDGSTAFSASLPTIATAEIAAGTVTISGTGLGHAERNDTAVKFTGAVSKTLSQQQIVAGGGSVSATSIVVPAALIPGAAATTTSVQVKHRARVSDVTVITT